MPLPQSGEGHIFTLVHTYIFMSIILFSTVLVFATPPLFQGFETCNANQICIGHVHKGNRILIQVIIAEFVPLNDIRILTIQHCTTVLVSISPPTVFEVATQFRRALNMRIRVPEFLSWTLLPKGSGEPTMMKCFASPGSESKPYE